MTVDNLLIELGTEELPPKSLRKLAAAFADNIQQALDKAELSYASVNYLASPRRLAVKVTELTHSQPDKVVEKRGPAVSVAFDADGNPTKAAEGWARSNGITVAEADRLTTDKGEWLLFKAEVKGQATTDLIAGFAADALAKLPIPNRCAGAATPCSLSVRPKP